MKTFALSVFVAGVFASHASTVNVSLSPPSLAQGQVAVVRVRKPPGSEVPVDLTVQWGDQKPSFWKCLGPPKKQASCALLAVPIDTVPGSHAIQVGWTEGGHGEQLELKLNVKPGKFQLNRLKVNPSLTHPSPEELKRIAEDKAEIDAAYALPSPPPLWKGGFDLPIIGGITSCFGNKRTFNGEVKSIHFGVDLRANAQTKVRAIGAGSILLAKLFFYAGNMVLMDHGAGIYSSYSHLSEIKVSKGASVAKGALIGMAGATGRVTGPHLHWGIRVNGVPVDPHQLRDLVNRVRLAR